MAIIDRLGKIVIISGFSGVGKGTAVKKLMEDFGHYALSVSMTTREPRDGEAHGVHYYFVPKEEFESRIAEDGFLEHARYSDHYYGTPKPFVIENIRRGIDVILEIEVQGALQVKKRHPEAKLIFITTPTAAELVNRLTGRKTETKEQILKRLKRAVDEAEYMARYDYIVINDKLEDCVRELEQIVATGNGGIPYDPEFKDTFVRDLKEILGELEKN